jgi:hypothetical protein
MLARARERRAEREASLDVRYRADFARHISDLYPGCPESAAIAIAEHACLKYSGRVGRSAEAKRFDLEAITLAVRAHVRHVHTDYDRLLIAEVDRHEARSQVLDEVDAVLDSWSQPPRAL